MKKTKPPGTSRDTRMIILNTAIYMAGAAMMLFAIYHVVMYAVTDAVKKLF